VAQPVGENIKHCDAISVFEMTPLSIEGRAQTEARFASSSERGSEADAVSPQASSAEDSSSKALFSGGEAAARSRLELYLWGTNSIQSYKETRNGMMDWNHSSKLSAWLSQGCLSARSIYHEIKRYESEVCSNDSTYWMIFELLWRDYFKFFSKKYGVKIFSPGGVKPNPKYQPVENRAEFESWSKANTREPFINANMRELNQTGWMSNRGRQNVASFLVHQMQLPWRWGAEYFETHLVDYDPDVNWGNWLYFSGNGSDPRARQFNVQTQVRSYDPEEIYQKKWLKEDKS
jgi:deoxyribodipyrimidine photo-lyase